MASSCGFHHGASLGFAAAAGKPLAPFSASGRQWMAERAAFV